MMRLTFAWLVVTRVVLGARCCLPCCRRMFVAFLMSLMRRASAALAALSAAEVPGLGVARTSSSSAATCSPDILRPLSYSINSSKRSCRSSGILVSVGVMMVRHLRHWLGDQALVHQDEESTYLDPPFAHNFVRIAYVQPPARLRVLARVADRGGDGAAEVAVNPGEDATLKAVLAVAVLPERVHDDVRCATTGALWQRCTSAHSNTRRHC